MPSADLINRPMPAELTVSSLVMTETIVNIHCTMATERMARVPVWVDMHDCWLKYQYSRPAKRSPMTMVIELEVYGWI